MNFTVFLQEIIQAWTIVGLDAQTTAIKAGVEFKLFMQEILDNTMYCIMYDMPSHFGIMQQG